MTWKRVATAAVLVPVVAGLVLWGSTAIVAIAIALVTLLALFEYFALGEAIGHRAYRFWTATCDIRVRRGRQADPERPLFAAQSDIREFTSWLGKRSYAARLERLGIQRIREIARENGKKGGRPPKGDSKKEKP